MVIDLTLSDDEHEQEVIVAVDGRGAGSGVMIDLSKADVAEVIWRSSMCWVCHTCTFLNEDGLLEKCSLCFAARETKKRGRAMQPSSSSSSTSSSSSKGMDVAIDINSRPRTALTSSASAPGAPPIAPLSSSVGVQGWPANNNIINPLTKQTIMMPLAHPGIKENREAAAAAAAADPSAANAITTASSSTNAVAKPAPAPIPTHRIGPRDPLLPPAAREQLQSYQQRALSALPSPCPARPVFTQKVSGGVRSYMNEVVRIALQSKAVRIPAQIQKQQQQQQQQQEGDGRRGDAHDSDDDNDCSDSDNDSDEGGEDDGDCLLWASTAWRAALASAADARRLLPPGLLFKVGLSSASGEEVRANVQAVLRMASTAAAATAGDSPSARDVGGQGKKKNNTKKQRRTKDAAQASRDAASHRELSRYPGWSLSATAAGHQGDSPDRDTHMVPLLRAALLSGAAAAAPVSSFDACLWCVAAADVATPSAHASRASDRAPCDGSDNSSFRLLHYVQLLRALSVAAAEDRTASSDCCSSSPSEPLVVAAVALQLAARLLRGSGTGNGGAGSERGLCGLDDGDGDGDGDDDRVKRRCIGDLLSSCSRSSSSAPLACEPLLRPLVGALCAVADSYFALHLRLCLRLQEGSCPPGGLSSVDKGSAASTSTLSSVIASASASAIASAVAGDRLSSSSFSAKQSSASTNGISTNGSSNDSDSDNQLPCVQTVVLVAVTHQHLAAMAREEQPALGDKDTDTDEDTDTLRRGVARAHPLVRLLVRATGDTDADPAVDPNPDTSTGAAANTAGSLLDRLEQASAVVHCCPPGPLARLLRTQLLLALGPEDVFVADAAVASLPPLSVQLRTERLGCALAQGLLADVVSGVGVGVGKGAVQGALSTGTRAASCGTISDGGSGGEGSDDGLLYRALQTLVLTGPKSGDDGGNGSVGGRKTSDRRLPQHGGSRQWPADKALCDFLSYLEA